LRQQKVVKTNAVANRSALFLTCACILSLAIASPLTAQEEASAAQMAQANNPLANASALNLQNYYASSLYGVPDRSTNTTWIRGVVPISRTVTRASLPLATRPSGSTESVSGLGDFNIFTAYLFVSNPTTSIGAGPLLVVPTATDDALGQGKWQAGAAAVAFKVTPLVQFGGLHQHRGRPASGGSDCHGRRAGTGEVAGRGSRRGIQGDPPGPVRRPADVAGLDRGRRGPTEMWQLGGGTYLRTTGVMTFDLKSGDYVVPIGFGLGQVIKSGKIVYNIFLEPQFSILHEGTGQPKVQVFAGINLQFPKG